MARDDGKPTVAIACGGTGGHFYPGMTIAGELRRNGARPILFVGGQHRDHHLRLAADAGLEAVELEAFRLPRRRLGYPWFAMRLGGTVLRTAWRLRRLRVDAVLGMGSFASAPLGLAAVLSRRPLYLHEGNAIPGQANRLLSRWARVLMLSLPLRRPLTTRAEQLVTGMPVRQAILDGAAVADDAAARRAMLARLGLAADAPVVLAFGGSQGAQRLNRQLEATARLRGPDGNRRWQLVHLTGQGDNRSLVEAYRAAGLRAWVRQRHERIEELYRLAAFAVCRAGASTITELALFGKPAILFPLPSAKDDHQRANAAVAADRGGALAVEEADCTPEKLSAILDRWLDDPAAVAERGERMAELARPDAVKAIAAVILNGRWPGSSTGIC